MFVEAISLLFKLHNRKHIIRNSSTEVINIFKLSFSEPIFMTTSRRECKTHRRCKLFIELAKHPLSTVKFLRAKRALFLARIGVNSGL